MNGSVLGKVEVNITHVSAVFDALSNPVRIRILQLVSETKRPLHIKAVAQTLQMDYATIYRHVDILKKAGLMQIFEVGRSRVLSLLQDEILNQLFVLAQQIKAE